MKNETMSHEAKCLIWTISAMEHLHALGYVGGGEHKPTKRGETVAASLRETGFTPTNSEIESCLAALVEPREHIPVIMTLIQKFCIEQWQELPPAQ